MVNPNIKDYGFGGKHRTPEQDDEYRRRGKGTPKRRWTKEKCVNELEDIMDIFKKILRDDEKLEKDNAKKLKQETVRDMVTMMNRMLDFMRYLYPPVQQNLNVNVDIAADAVVERLKKWKRGEMEIEVKE